MPMELSATKSRANRGGYLSLSKRSESAMADCDAGMSPDEVTAQRPPQRRLPPGIAPRPARPQAGRRIPGRWGLRPARPVGPLPARLQERDQVRELARRELLVEPGRHDRDGAGADFLDVGAGDPRLLVGAGHEDDL